MSELLKQFWSGLGSNAPEIIATCAMVATVVQAYLTRKHNRLTLRPYLNATFLSGPSENSRYIEASITLHNVGLGPALLEQLSLKTSGGLVPANAENIEELLRDRFGPKAELPWFVSPHSSCVLKAGEDFDLLKLRVPMNDGHTRHTVDQWMKSLIKINYRSAYNEKFELL